MARKSKQLRDAEAAAEKAFYAVANGRQFDIMALPEIFDAGVNAALAGQDVRAAVSAACDKFARN